MSELKYTKGPWDMSDRYEGLIAIDAPISSTDYDESIEICRISIQDEEDEKGNASIVAHAPEMYEMLKSHFEDAEDRGDSRDEDGKLYEEYRNMQDLLDRIKLEGME